MISACSSDQGSSQVFLWKLLADAPPGVSVCRSSSHYGVSQPAASVSSGHLLEIRILRPHPRLPKSETLGPGPSHLCVSKPFRRF